MGTPLLLLALCAIPPALQTHVPPFSSLTVDEKLEAIAINIEAEAELMTDRDLELKEQVEKLQNITNHLVQELDIVRSRQAASAGVQASQVIMMVTYLLTLICTWGISRCQKVSEKAKRKEFERLEMQLRSSKARRRAAAAQEKSAQAQSLE